MNQIAVNFGNKAFDKIRATHITGTDVSACCCPAFDGVVSVILSKRGHKKAITKAMQDGLDVEEDACLEIERILKEGKVINGRLIKAVKVWQPKTVYYHNGISANVDYFALLTTGEVIIIEFKSAQNLTHWKLEDEYGRKGRITKTGYQLGHYGYVCKDLIIDGYKIADWGLMVFLNLESYTMHFETLEYDHAKAEANIEKTKRSLEMVESDLSLDEVLSLPIGKKDLDAAKEVLKSVHMDTITLDGDKKTAFIPDTENNRSLFEYVKGMKTSIKEAEEKLLKVESFLMSQNKAEINSGLELNLSLSKRSETFDFASLKKDSSKLEKLKKRGFMKYFTTTSGSFSVKFGG